MSSNEGTKRKRGESLNIVANIIDGKMSEKLAMSEAAMIEEIEGKSDEIKLSIGAIGKDVAGVDMKCTAISSKLAKTTEVSEATSVKIDAMSEKVTGMVAKSMAIEDRVTKLAKTTEENGAEIKSLLAKVLEKLNGDFKEQDGKQHTEATPAVETSKARTTTEQQNERRSAIQIGLALANLLGDCNKVKNCVTLVALRTKITIVEDNFQFILQMGYDAQSIEKIWDDTDTKIQEELRELSRLCSNKKKMDDVPDVKINKVFQALLSAVKGIIKELKGNYDPRKVYEPWEQPVFKFRAQCAKYLLDTSLYKGKKELKPRPDGGGANKSSQSTTDGADPSSQSTTDTSLLGAPPEASL